MTPTDSLDVHLTALFTWLAEIVGKAALIWAGIAVVFGALGVFTNSLGLALLGNGVGFLAAAFYLTTTSAPLPSGLDDDA